jgi:putative redox protein
MTSRIIYKGNLRTEMTHLQSGTIVETDAPKDNQGLGEKFSPTDLVSSALGACMISIMGIAGRTHDIEVEETIVDIEKIMIADPQRRIGEIKVDLRFPLNKTYNDKQRKIIEHAAMTCPVFLSLSENVKKTVTFHW